MNLIKNVDGDWTQSKSRIRQDLDTIQRSINQILAQINTPVAATVVPPATISSANTVTTYGSTALTSVAVKPGSLITGNGKITNPLDMPGVNVSATGALTGSGTSASPLAVQVDGTTVTINGSNQLTASAGASALSILVSSLITVSNSQALAGGDIADVIAAPGAGNTIMPLWVEAHAFVSVAYAAARNIELRYSQTVGGGGGSAADALSSISSGIRNTTGDYRYLQPCLLTNNSVAYNSATRDNINKSIYLNLGAANGAGNGANNVKIKIYYAIIADI